MNHAHVSLAASLLLSTLFCGCGLIDDSRNTFASQVDSGNDAAVSECTSGERRSCTSGLTGCPDSFDLCSSSLEMAARWEGCECRECVLPLGADACSWTLQRIGGWIAIPVLADDITTVVARSDVAISTDFHFVDSESACLATGGWYPVAEIEGTNQSGYPITSSLTITLCPFSCAEHFQVPPVEFTLGRGGCPSS